MTIDRARVPGMVAAGNTIAQIAEELKCSKPYAMRLAKQAGFQPLPQIDRREAEALMRAGKGDREIATAIGSTPRAVSRLRVRLGLGAGAVAGAATTSEWVGPDGQRPKRIANNPAPERTAFNDFEAVAVLPDWPAWFAIPATFEVIADAAECAELPAGVMVVGLPSPQKGLLFLGRKAGVKK